MRFLDKLKNLLSKNADKVDTAIDKAGDLVDQKTQGKYADTIDKVQAAAAKKYDAEWRRAHYGVSPGRSSDWLPTGVRAEETSVLVYIDSDDPLVVMRFYAEIEKLLDSLGFDHQISKVSRGSVLLRIRAWFGDPNNRRAVNNALLDVGENAERYAKAQINRAVAETDGLNARSFREAAEAAGDRDFICLFEGFVGIRYTKPDGEQVQVYRKLTAREAAVVESSPWLLDNPRTFLTAIAELIFFTNPAAQPEING